MAIQATIDKLGRIVIPKEAQLVRKGSLLVIRSDPSAPPVAKRG